MSRRTSEASRAVRAAWQKEQELVSAGKGTRDWTAEQQKEILELGKAYYHSEDPNDINDGKAFEGHHMKSAETYPEYQGDPENIQFLSRPEHLEAHGGDYRNPTNGYLDPVTKIMRDFGNNKYVPCEIIKLTDPIASLSSVSQASSEMSEISPKENVEKSLEIEQRKYDSVPKEPSASKTSTIRGFVKTSIEFVEKGAKWVGEFVEENPELIETVLKTVGLLALDAFVKKGQRSGSTIDDDHSDCFDRDDCDDSSSVRDYPDERSSPEEHTVTAHGQRYHTRDGVIWKEKEPYQRGGKHGNDQS